MALTSRPRRAHTLCAHGARTLCAAMAHAHTPRHSKLVNIVSLMVCPHLISNSLSKINHNSMLICLACVICSMLITWTVSKLCNKFIAPFLYDPVMNNATSNNNIYLGLEREEWRSIIKNFESPL
ncbi:hypothetical protein U9M48_018289 [Paspalum notatum var. saurae]|uniref:Uncharacterized protein n=1 Tax=Paspalum notatum var. saurae TaxID=547442 RepID=A0AAQ3TBH9_PASNO